MRTLSAGEVRRALAATERSSKPGGDLSSWMKRGALIAGAVLLLTLLTGWALGWYSTPRQVLEVRAAINEQIAELDKVSHGQSPFVGGPDMGKVRDSMRHLPEGMRDQVRRDFGRLMEAGETAQVNSFFILPPAQRQAELDRRIKAEDDARKKRSADRAKGGNRGSPQGAGGQPGGAAPATARPPPVTGVAVVVAAGAAPVAAADRGAAVAVAAHAAGSPRKSATTVANRCSTIPIRSSGGGGPNTVVRWRSVANRSAAAAVDPGAEVRRHRLQSGRRWQRLTVAGALPSVRPAQDGHFGSGLRASRQLRRFLCQRPGPFRRRRGAATPARPGERHHVDARRGAASLAEASDAEHSLASGLGA